MMIAGQFIGGMCMDPDTAGMSCMDGASVSSFDHENSVGLHDEYASEDTESDVPREEPAMISANECMSENDHLTTDFWETCTSVIMQSFHGFSLNEQFMEQYDHDTLLSERKVH